MIELERLDFSKGGGYVTVVCQDARTARVLMVARADREALARTMATGEMHYHSRSRGLWHKGATSGHLQRVVSLMGDCDGDAVLALVEPAGPACHRGTVSCFDGSGPSGGVGAGEREASSPARESPPVSTEEAVPDVLAALATTIAERQAALPIPEGSAASYTQRLLSNRNLRLKKLGEEAAELAVACADGDTARAAQEGADVMYHTLVALAAIGVTWLDVARVLDERAR